MRTTKSRPNIVTFTTLIRAVGHARSIDPLESLRFVQDARQEERFDESLFWEALDVCAVRKSVDGATAVLRELASCEPSVVRSSDRVVHALTHVVREHEDGERCLEQWVAEALVTADEYARITSADASISTPAGGFAA